MMRIRAEQLAVLAIPQRKAFVERIALLLHEHWPEECEALGRDGLAAFVEDGMARGAAYGFVSERHVVRYLNLQFLLGRAFDVGEDGHWARELLADRWQEPDRKLSAVAERIRGAVDAGESR